MNLKYEQLPLHVTIQPTATTQLLMSTMHHLIIDMQQPSFPMQYLMGAMQHMQQLAGEAKGHLDLSRQNVVDSDLPAILKFLDEHPEITSLDLSFNNLTAKAAEYLSTNKTLEKLNLTSNRLGNNGALLIATHPKLVELNLRANRIGDEGTANFGKNSTLRKVNLRFNKISHKGLENLVTETNIIHLNLRHNRIGNKGMGYIKNNNKLLTLNLRSNHISDDGAVLLAGNRSLVTVNLLCNSIAERGGAALSLNRTIRKMILDDNLLRVSAKALARKHTAESLTMTYNHITDEDKEDIRTGNPYKKMKYDEKLQAQHYVPSLRTFCIFALQNNPDFKLEKAKPFLNNEVIERLKRTKPMT